MPNYAPIFSAQRTTAFPGRRQLGWGVAEPLHAGRV